MQEYWCGGAAKAKEQETVFLLPLLSTEVVERELGIPSSAYVRTCVAGYFYFGFHTSFLDEALRISREGALR